MPGGFRSGAHITSLALLLAAASTLTGCASRTGDFGRPSPTASSASRFVAEHTPDFPALYADITAPDIDLTEAERELVRRMWHFRNPVAKWPQAGPTARANAIADAVAADHENYRNAVNLLPVVGDKDRIRREAMGAFPAIPDKIQSRASEQIAANAAMRVELCQLAMARAARYRADLETLVVAAPENEVVPAERRLLVLEADLMTGCAAIAGGSLNSGTKGYTRQGGTDPSGAPADIRAPLMRKG